MGQSEIILCGIKLVFGALAAFCVILLASKKRSTAVILLAVYTILSYAETVYSLLGILGISILQDLVFFDTPILTLALTALPRLFLVLSLVFFIKENRS